MDPGWQFGHESRSVFGRAEGTEGARGGRDPGKEKGRDRRRAPRGGARPSLGTLWTAARRFRGPRPPAPAGDVTQFNAWRRAANRVPLTSSVSRGSLLPCTRPPFAPRSMGKAGALTPFLTLHGACPTTGKYPRKTEHQKITYLGRSFRFREIQVCGKHRGTFNTLQERQENAKDFWVGRVGKSFLERTGSSLMLSGGRVPGWCPHKCLP